MREVNSKTRWLIISGSQKLSEKFIRESKEKVDWVHISLHQEMSICFIDEMIQEGFIKPHHYKFLLRNKKINQEELVAYFSLG